MLRAARGGTVHDPEDILADAIVEVARMTDEP